MIGLLTIISKQKCFFSSHIHNILCVFFHLFSIIKNTMLFMIRIKELVELKYDKKYTQM